MKKGSQRNRNSVKESEFLECMSYEEIFHLAVYFQNQKRKFFIKFLQCLDRQIEEGYLDLELPFLQQERLEFWERHEYYEELVQWCLEETIKRTKKSNGRNFRR